MRIPVKYSLYRFDLKGHRLGTIHVALRRGQTPQDHAYVHHNKVFQQYNPADAVDVHRWSQYLKRNYPEYRHDNPEPSS